jgi:hypothetical protein
MKQASTRLSFALRGLSCLPLALLALLPLAGAAEKGTPSVWTQDTFQEFAAGRFGDSGANAYVSAKGNIQLVNRWDLNNDGSIDLVFCNTHPHVEKLDAAIYWGNGRDFDDRRKSYVPNEGAQRTIAADLDGDGRPDAVIPNYTNGTWTNMDSSVYYQAAAPAGKSWENPPFRRKVSLPTQAAQGAAVADLNRDGHPDIVFALSAGFWEYRGGAALASPSRIFWGAGDGFTRERFTDLEASGAADVAAEDLNGDGWPEVVFANREQAGKFAVDSYVYWGGREGFSTGRRTGLPTDQANAVTVADVNRAGRPDLLFANGEGKESWIYFNRKGVFSPADRAALPASDARDCAVADVNGDTWPDVFFSSHQTAGNPLTLSPLYFGGADGFRADRKQDFETVGAWGASLADLNGDQRPDLVVSCNREYTSFDVPSYIYWNAASGFDLTRRTALFTRGAAGNTVADFNGDGHADLVFNNTIGRSRGGTTPSYVYWGNPRGQFTPERRWEFPAVEPYDWASADLDDDGWPELIVANQAEIGRRITESFIHWGGPAAGGAPGGFSEERRSTVLGHGAKGISVADLDRDGYLDLVLYNALPESGIYVYWGGKDGYATTERTALPFGSGGTPAVADLNGDGHLDIIATNNGRDRNAILYWGDSRRGFPAARRTEVPDTAGATNAEVADLNQDGRPDLILTRRGTTTSLIYFAGADGAFSTARRKELKTADCQGVTVGDLDRDGWLDIVAPSYSRSGSRATQSKVYFGSRDGYEEERAVLLPTNAGTGSQIADYNRDGHNDLLLICHRSEGDPDRVGVVSDHVTPSFLYWGAAGDSGSGWTFRSDRKLLIPSRGAHYDSGVDLGNISDRKFRWDYVSAPHQYGRARGARLEWKARTPHGTAVEFQIRTAAARGGLEQAPWRGPAGKDAYTAPGSRLATPTGHAWVQYRAVLVSPDGASSPVLDRVSLSFR